MRRRAGDANYWLVVFAFGLVAFSAGALLDRAGWLPGAGGNAPPGVGRTFAPFWEAWRAVEENYVLRDHVKPRQMTEGAIEGMLDSLGDNGHTTYLSPEKAKELARAMEGKLEGIGAQMTVRKNLPTVVYTVPGSPARAAGLRPGDVLLEVDGKSVAGLPLDRIVLMVRGPAGSKVHLLVEHEGSSVKESYNIVRAKVDVPVVAWTMVPGTKVAHISLREFGVNADTQLKAAVEAARRQGATGLIFDLRGNPGGLKDQAVAVTSEFLKDGIVFIEQDAQGQRENVDVKPGGIATSIPLVALIDEGSASSAEICAGALQDHKRGKLVGTRTFGTGTVLQPFELSDGSAILLAVQEWFTPDGRQIWHKGIAPDIEVKLPEGVPMLLPEDEERLTPAELRETRDAQFLHALEALQKELQKAKKAA